MQLMQVFKRGLPLAETNDQYRRTSDDLLGVGQPKISN